MLLIKDITFKPAETCEICTFLLEHLYKFYSIEITTR